MIVAHFVGLLRHHTRAGSLHDIRNEESTHPVEPAMVRIIPVFTQGQQTQKDPDDWISIGPRGSAFSTSHLPSVSPGLRIGFDRRPGLSGRCRPRLQTVAIAVSSHPTASARPLIGVRSDTATAPSSPDLTFLRAFVSIWILITSVGRHEAGDMIVGFATDKLLVSIAPHVLSNHAIPAA
jgi:hypothetical protein